MLNREDVIEAIDTAVGGLKADFDRYAASRSTGGERRAAEILDQAHAEAAAIISQTEVARAAEAQAAEILARARAESEELLVEADRYVETRLAAFEAELQVTTSRVATMRQRLLDRSHLGDQAAAGEAAWPTTWDG
jgi:hypothetical protein